MEKYVFEEAKICFKMNLNLSKYVQYSYSHKMESATSMYSRVGLIFQSPESKMGHFIASRLVVNFCASLGISAKKWPFLSSNFTLKKVPEASNMIWLRKLRSTEMSKNSLSGEKFKLPSEVNLPNSI